MTMTAQLDRTPLHLTAARATRTTDRTSVQTPPVQTQAAQTPAAQTSVLSINAVMAALLAAVIVAAFVGFGGDAAANGPLQPASEHSSVVDAIEIYVVQPGDTLWSIATAVSVDGEDIRPLVDHLKSVAGGSALDVGQRIVIDHATMRS